MAIVCISRFKQPDHGKSINTAKKDNQCDRQYGHRNNFFKNHGALSRSDLKIKVLLIVIVIDATAKAINIKLLILYHS